MFFFITHLVIDKYYPNPFTQFIVGCIFYTVILMIAGELINDSIYDKYKYQTFGLIIIDVMFLINQKQTLSKDNMKTYEVPLAVKTGVQTEVQTTSDKTSIDSISLSSEMNDYKMTHSLSDANDSDDLFSTDKKPEEKLKNKESEETNKSSS